MKAKKFLALFLSLIMALSCMSFTAFADGSATVVETSGSAVEWSSGNYVVEDEYVNLTCGLIISGNVTLTINENCTLTICGEEGAIDEMRPAGKGLYINSDASLTINGSGSLEVVGGEGGYGITSSNRTGQDGGTGIVANGTLIVNGIDLNVVGGSGGNGYYEGGDGGNGGSSFVGKIVMTSGRLYFSNAVPGFSNGTGYEDGIDGSDGSFAQGSSFSGGIFCCDVSSYVADGYICVANTDNESKDAYPYTVVSGTYLDLETSATYPQSTTVDQTYTLTQTGDTTYTDVTKVRVSWVLPEISASYTLNKTWNPDTLSWVDAKTTATISEKTATFTFTNLSSVAVGATVSFKKSIVANSESETVSDVLTLKSIVNQETHAQQYPEAPSGTITHKYTPTASEFNSLANGSGTYGVYTVSLKPAYCVTVSYYADENANAYSTAKFYVAEGTEITVNSNTITIGDETPVTTALDTISNGTFYNWSGVSSVVSSNMNIASLYEN